jgi:hypothetical protein
MKKYIKHRGRWRFVSVVKQHGKSVPNTVLPMGSLHIPRDQEGQTQYFVIP